MGYNTSFDGKFVVTPPLSYTHADYLRAFSETRRVQRDEAVTSARPDPKRKVVGLPVGVEGGYFVGANGLRGQEERNTLGIVNYNTPPKGQPSLWCDWTPNNDGTAIVFWNDSDKFYDYIDWIKYLITHFLAPWGYTLNGEVKWQGDRRGDSGVIVVTNNVVKVKRALASLEVLSKGYGVLLNINDGFYVITPNEAIDLANRLLEAARPRCTVSGCLTEAGYCGPCKAHQDELQAILDPIIAERSKAFEAVEEQFGLRLDAAQTAWRAAHGVSEEAE